MPGVQEKAAQHAFRAPNAPAGESWMRPIPSDSLRRPQSAAPQPCRRPAGANWPQYTPNEPYTISPAVPAAGFSTRSANNAGKNLGSRRSRVAEHTQLQQSPAPAPLRPAAAGHGRTGFIQPQAASAPIRRDPSAQPAVPPARQTMQPAPVPSGMMRAPGQLTSSPKPPVEDDWLDDEQEDAVPTASMASPVPVPTMDFSLPSKPRRRGWLIVLVGVIVTAGIAAAVWQTGLWARLLPPAVPTTESNRIPAIFAASPQGSAATDAGLSPAKAPDAPRLEGFSVEPASAAAPAALTFSLHTLGETTSIRLLNDQGVMLAGGLTSAPEGDGVLWTLQIPFNAPYQGGVHAYLRDKDGAWTDGGLICQIAVE